VIAQWMRTNRLRRTSIAVLTLASVACSQPVKTNESANAETAVSYARLDAGSKARPSNHSSKQLFNMGDQVRLATFRNYLTQSGQQCALVTSAVLKGGYHHIDMWRVGCSDTGEWMVSIEPDSSTKILSCTTMKRLGDDCHASWTQ